MYLEILTPESRLYSGDVKLVSVPGSKGSFEILNNHAPLISTLETGKIKVIETNGQILFFQIKQGVVECLENRIHALVTTE
ncbi:MAG: F0F1 ATP synthase subunit epsilon [Bacteroidota bacterium]